MSLPITGLTLTFSDGNLVSSDGTIIPLQSLSKMFFTETSGITLLPSHQPEGVVDAYSTSGSYLGRYSDAQEAIRRLPKGLYMFKDSTGNVVKTLVK